MANPEDRVFRDRTQFILVLFYTAEAMLMVRLRHCLPSMTSTVTVS